MESFTFARAADAGAALSLAGNAAGAKFIGGGTNLVDLMRESIERPAALIDVNSLSRAIDVRPDGSLCIGAAVTNTELAAHDAVRARFPALSRAILAGASGQIRNMATVAGNILQRTRCTYFYDDAAACNKRNPGAGCDARDGFHRNHAIFGASPACSATHPSDMCVALAAFDAIVHTHSASGERRIPLVDLHRLPGDAPERETCLAPNELITAIELPPLSFGDRSTYRKVRDRASYAFALVSLAAAIDVEDGAVKDVRLAFGGVAAKPWRARRAEEALRGRPATKENFHQAAAAEFAAAEPLPHNGFKVELGRRLIPAVLGGLIQGDAA